MPQIPNPHCLASTRPHCRRIPLTQDILYALLLSRSPSPRVITLTRPKKQSIHPSDLHILLNTLSSKSLSANAASAWLPICLPKYNSDGFLYVYVGFMSENSINSHHRGNRHDENDDRDGSDDVAPSNGPDAGNAKQRSLSKGGADEGNEICLAIVTPKRDDFDRVHTWAQSIESVGTLGSYLSFKLLAYLNINFLYMQSLRSSNLLKQLITSCKHASYSVNELAIPGLRHFLYKSRAHVQITSPVWEDPYDEPGARNRYDYFLF